MELPQRKHPRLKSYDYSSTGVYYVTICTYKKKCLLSRVVGRGLAPAVIELTDYGKIAEEQLLFLEKRYLNLKIMEYIVMPNHIHAIMYLKKDVATPSPTLMDIVCAYKSLTTRFCKQCKPINRVFQVSFFEHVLRTRRDYDETVRYIYQNPQRWLFDELYSNE